MDGDWGLASMEMIVFVFKIWLCQVQDSWLGIIMESLVSWCWFKVICSIVQVRIDLELDMSLFVWRSPNRLRSVFCFCCLYKFR